MDIRKEIVAYDYAAKYFSSKELNVAGLHNMSNVADLIKSAPSSYYEAIAHEVENSSCGFIPTIDGSRDDDGMEKLASYHDFLVFEAGEMYIPVPESEEEWFAADDAAFKAWNDEDDYPHESKPMSDREMFHHGYFGLEG